MKDSYCDRIYKAWIETSARSFDFVWELGFFSEPVRLWISKS